MKIDSWKVILTTDDGENMELENIPEDITAQVDAIIEEAFPTTWKDEQNKEWDEEALEDILETLRKGGKA